MPKKQQQSRNPFYFFMLDYKQEQEKRGAKFPNGLKDVANAASAEWQNINPEDKAYYEKLAKEEKLRSGMAGEKFTSQGVSYAEIDRQEREKKKIEEQEVADVDDIIRTASLSNSIEEQVFHVIDVDVYCTTLRYDHVPMEISLAVFNLSEGVREIFHTFVNTEIPTGYYSEAKQACDRHGISGPPIDFGEDDIFKILSSLIDFTESDPTTQTTKYPLFTMPNNIPRVKGALKYLCDITNVSPDMFKVYNLSKLFYNLKNTIAKHPTLSFPAETMAFSELTKDVFAYTKGLACTVDEENDTSLQCTKSQVQRWCFTICDHCCHIIGIPLELGKHVPASTNISNDHKSNRSVSSMSNAAMPSWSGATVKQKRPSTEMSNYSDVSYSAAPSSVGSWSSPKEPLNRMTSLHIDQKSFARAASGASSSNVTPSTETSEVLEFRRPYTASKTGPIHGINEVAQKMPLGRGSGAVSSASGTSRNRMK